MITAEQHIQQIVLKTIPIYTLLHPHPVKKRPDCNMTKDYKRRLRDQMIKRMMAIVEEIELKVSEL